MYSKKRRVVAFLQCRVYTRKATRAHFKGHICNPLSHILNCSITVYINHGTRLANRIKACTFKKTHFRVEKNWFVYHDSAIMAKRECTVSQKTTIDMLYMDTDIF